MNIIVRQPRECSNDLLNDFVDLVNIGEEVVAHGLLTRVKGASKLIFHYTDDRLSGVAAIKKPYDTYKKKVFRKAKATNDPSNFTYELGWIFVREENRGQKIGNKLLDTLLSEIGNSRSYATTRTNNEIMIRKLNEYGYEKEGFAYESEQGNHELLLLVK